MTAFEEQLSALPSMAEVRVRRFGAGRAEIEIETVGVVPVARELMRVAPDARPTMLPDGSLSVELTAERWTGGAAPPAEPEEAGASDPHGAESEPGGDPWLRPSQTRSSRWPCWWVWSSFSSASCSLRW